MMTSSIRRRIVILFAALITSIVVAIAFSHAPSRALAALATKLPTTPRPTSTPLVPFPTVPAEGNTLTVVEPYTHPTGWFSIPHLEGWDVDKDGEETLLSTRISKLTRVGTRFTNYSVLSVIHVFVERDPARRAQKLPDLDRYYSPFVLAKAWSNYEGGWKEIKRQVVNKEFIIDFELYQGNHVYLARQISRFDKDWLMVMRLVVPGNNPKLLDQLQKALSTEFRMEPTANKTPTKTRTPTPTKKP